VTTRRSENYLYVTWLSKLMAGEVSCQWATWFRTHYQDFPRVPSDPSLALHVAQHTQLLVELTEERRASGERTVLEAQGFFRVRLSPTMVIGGKPDLVTIDAEGRAKVWDCKSGKQKHSDTLQVMLYMLCLPHAMPEFKGKSLDGCVVYRTGERVEIPRAVIDDDFKVTARRFANLLDADHPPLRVPSAPECRFCDITAADCAERIELMPAYLRENPPEIDWSTVAAAI
jgi:hypothetical protein